MLKRCYYTNTDAIIYVVDSADRDRVGISKQELVSMLEEEELKDAVLVVLANKQDIEGAMSVTEVHSALGLDKLKNRTFQIFKVLFLVLRQLVDNTDIILGKCHQR